MEGKDIYILLMLTLLYWSQRVDEKVRNVV